MHSHGPSCLSGPVSRDLPWWTGFAPAALSGPREHEKKKRGGESRPHDAEVRWDLVARVRREIAAGSYDTPDKIEAALAQLLENHQGD